MLGSAWTLIRVRGIPIRIHFTLLLILPYIAILIAARFGAVAEAAGVPPDELGLPPWAWGLVLAVGLFVGVLLHELAHAFVARRHGATVRGITLMMLGGISEIEGMAPDRPGETSTSAAGPLLSLALGGVAWLGYLYLPIEGGARFALFYFANLNIIIGIFNFLPAFPMDGGRVLRSLLMRRMGVVRATRAATRVGKGMAAAFGVLGLLGGNLLLVLIAVFVWFGAGAEERAVTARATLADVRAEDLMVAEVPRVSAREPLERAASVLAGSHAPALLVVEGERPVGMLGVGSLKRARRGRPGASASEAMEPLIEIEAGTPAADALERIEGSGASAALVTRGGAPVGLLGPQEIARGLEVLDWMAERGPQPRST